MTNVSDVRTTEKPTSLGLKRLHHLAYTTTDMEATRRFYEDVIGMPLTQTWIESPAEGALAGRSYVHCFYGLEDGGAIAYFEYDGTPPAEQAAANFHVAFKTDAATQQGIRDRLLGAGYREEDIRLTDHGYCVSLYVTDPNGLRLEFTVDHEQIDEIAARQAEMAHAELERWRRGERTSNNTWRPADH